MGSDCPRCGSADGGAETRAIMHYDKAPTMEQKELDWPGDAEDLAAIVCIECGYPVVVVVLDDDDEEDAGRERATSEYKVDRELR